MTGMCIISNCQLSVLRGWVLTMQTDCGLYFVITLFVLFSWILDYNLSCLTWMSAACFSHKRNLDEAFVIFDWTRQPPCLPESIPSTQQIWTFRYFSQVNFAVPGSSPAGSSRHQVLFLHYFCPGWLSNWIMNNIQRLFLMDLAQCYYHVA